MKTDIKNREDVAFLVKNFYDKIKIDPVLGPIFNGLIKKWDNHLIHLTTFWESSLFMSRDLKQKYTGNPIEAHLKVDAFTQHNINETHFGIWLNYWSQTIDANFEGEIANLAKRRARKMATFIHIKLFEARQ